MTDSIVTTNVIESVVIGGDLSKLSSEQRVSYYKAVCGSIGLNPLTKPFDYITLSGRLTLYARKDATDQLRKIHDVSITKLERERIDSIYTVTAYAQDNGGRQDSSIGAVNIDGLKGDALANAIMKAETKAKRRVTLSLCGLGMLDETELETIPEVRKVAFPTYPDAQDYVFEEDYKKAVEKYESAPASSNPLRPHPELMPVNVAAAFARVGSDKKEYGDCTDDKLQYKVTALEAKLKQELAQSEQDKVLAALEDISLIRDWRKQHPA